MAIFDDINVEEPEYHGVIRELIAEQEAEEEQLMKQATTSQLDARLFDGRDELGTDPTGELHARTMARYEEMKRQQAKFVPRHLRNKKR